MSKHAKEIRNQVRNVAKELLTEDVIKLIADEIYARVTKDMNVRMTLIADNAKQTLEKIDERSKNVQDYVLRTVAKAPLTPSDKE